MEMKSRIMSALVDTLVNSMETFIDSNDFEEYLNNEYDIDSSVAKKMFADYWKISANDRFEWDYLEWSRWLKRYGIRESVMKIEKKDRKVLEIKEEVRVRQDDYDIILEKGDRIQIIEESYKVITDTQNLVREGIIDRITNYLNRNEAYGAPWVIARIKRYSEVRDSGYLILAFMKNGYADHWKDKGVMRTFVTRGLSGEHFKPEIEKSSYRGIWPEIIYEIESDFYEPGKLL